MPLSTCWRPFEIAIAMFLFVIVGGFGVSLALHRTGYWGSIGEFDMRAPLVKDRVGLITFSTIGASRMVVAPQSTIDSPIGTSE